MILHWTHTWGGGTQKYIDDLCTLFPNEKHTIMNSPPFQINLEEIKVLHIHSTMVGMNIGWGVLNLVDALFGKKKIVLSIHDYQWLFPQCPNPTTEELETFKIPKENVENFKKLIKKCDVVFMHTKNLHRRYEKFCGPLDDVTIGYPCDVPVYYERFFIPEIKTKIKIGFLGGSAQHKGFYQCVDLAKKFKEFEFHVYGSKDIESSSLVVSHGVYKDENVTETIRNDGMHILLALSLSEETYCYALTKMINTGIPIVYLNRGSFTERLSSSSKCERFFPVDNLCDLGNVIMQASEYVKINSNTSKDVECCINENLELNDTYKNIYTI